MNTILGVIFLIKSIIGYRSAIKPLNLFSRE
jgi:hypothetical protein